MKINCPLFAFIAGITVTLFFSCVSAGTEQAKNEGEPIMQIALNYPVVLVHGIAMYDRTGAFNAWGKIPKTLVDKGVQVFYGNTDAWSSYESNALMLKESIEKILSETGKEKVNIIAHSKGGIDSRYLIWEHDFGGKIASLTTICTPHRGAETADLVYNQELVHTKMSLRVLALYGKLSSDIRPNIYQVNYQLTTMYMKEFNEKVIMDNMVYCQSLYTIMNNIFDDLLFRYTYPYINSVSGANDGLVSAYSAQWGSNYAKIDSGISHREIIGLKKRIMPSKNISAIYIGIVKDLSKKGF
jgi:triacylglycerol lipase